MKKFKTVSLIAGTVLAVAVGTTYAINKARKRKQTTSQLRLNLRGDELIDYIDENMPYNEYGDIDWSQLPDGDYKFDGDKFYLEVADSTHSKTIAIYDRDRMYVNKSQSPQPLLVFTLNIKKSTVNDYESIGDVCGRSTYDFDNIDVTFANQAYRQVCVVFASLPIMDFDYDYTYYVNSELVANTPINKSSLNSRFKESINGLVISKNGQSLTVHIDFVTYELGTEPITPNEWIDGFLGIDKEHYNTLDRESFDSYVELMVSVLNDESLNQILMPYVERIDELGKKFRSDD